MASMKDLSNDERFSRVSKDPRFWEMPEKDKKIKIDQRFRAMFDDNKFNLKYTVDKRGRPMNHSTVQDMKRFYDLAESEESDSTEAPHFEKSQKVKKKKKKKKMQMISDSTQLNTSSHSNEECKIKDKVDFLERSDSQEGPNSFTVMHSVRKPTLKMGRGEKKDCKEMNVLKSQIKGGYKLAQKTEKKQKAIGLSSADQSKERIEITAEGTNKAKKFTKETNVESESDEAPELETSDESQSVDKSLDLGERQEDDDVAEDGDTESEDEDSVVQTSEEENSDSEEEEDGEESDSGPDLARGKGNMETSSEDEQDEDMVEIFPKEPEFDHAWGELDKTAPQTDEITRRLAVCNMDWDRLKAKDLLALFNSFKPKGGVIFSVKIYPSEYGKERMQTETVQGPIELKELPEDATDEQKICREKLREYQFKRLKYFYAVVECDSPETANSIYEECDGLEYESSCSFVDLRFIPDDVTFDDEPKDIATDVDFSAYKPKYFTSPAMTTSKVEITWDETDSDRLTSLNRTFNKDEILDLDFQAYLASSSEDEIEEEQEDHQKQQGKAEEDSAKSIKSHKDDDEQIAKYRELLKTIQDKDKKHEDNDMEMEITWVPGFKESAEQMVKNKLEGKDSLTPWERFLQKKKDKRKLKKKKKDKKDEQSEDDALPPDVDLSDPFFAEEFAEQAEMKKKSKKKKADLKHEASGEESDVERKKAEIALLMMDDDEDDRKHFNYEKIVEQQNLSKKKKKKLVKKQELLEDDFEINVADTRFQSMFTSHLYNVDPSDPHFKKTKAMEKVLEEKIRRREQEQAQHKEALKTPGKKTEDEGKQQNTVKKSLDPALSMLIKSVKSKTEQFQARKKQKVK